MLPLATPICMRLKEHQKLNEYAIPIGADINPEGGAGGMVQQPQTGLEPSDSESNDEQTLRARAYLANAANAGTSPRM
jgi:hypothetical protein